MIGAGGSQEPTESTARHGWLDAPWPQPTDVARRDSARSRRVNRQVLVVVGAVMTVSCLLPWEEHFKWFPGDHGSHHYLSFESTFGLALPPWATLVPFLGAALVYVALRVHPDTRRAGLILVAIAAASVVCCALAIARYESVFFSGLNQAKAWGACGPAVPCANLAPPWRDAAGAGAYLATGAAFVALVASLVFTRSAWHRGGSRAKGA